MQSLVEREKHIVWESEVTVWQEESFELSQKSSIPEAPLAFLSLFSAVLTMFTHLLGCLGASHGAASIFHA